MESGLHGAGFGVGLDALVGFTGAIGQLGL